MLRSSSRTTKPIAILCSIVNVRASTRLTNVKLASFVSWSLGMLGKPGSGSKVWEALDREIGEPG